MNQFESICLKGITESIRTPNHAALATTRPQRKRRWSQRFVQWNKNSRIQDSWKKWRQTV